MQFVDANIFLRYLTKDDPIKAQACYELFKKAERSEVTLTTSEAVIAEIVYVLSSSRLYGLSREDVRVRLLPLLALPGLRLTDRTIYLRALEIYAAYHLDFEDALAIAHMEHQGITEIYSYDRDFDSVVQVKRIEP